MSDTLQRIDEYLAHQKKVRLLLEQDTTQLDAGIMKMIVDGLPELALGEDFQNKMKSMLADKLDDAQITIVMQALISQLPIKAEDILKGLVL